jgi:hypothetical protein
MIECYKIKDPDYEYYSSGLRNGYLHKSKKGKTWSTLGAIKSHLTAVSKWDSIAFTYYDKWIVIKMSQDGIEIIGTVKDFK